MNLKTSENKYVFYTILFYVIAIFIVVIINFSGKFTTGPCNPGLDIMSIFMLVVFNIVLLIATTISTFISKKKTKNLFFIHLSIFFIWLIYVIVGLNISN